MQLVLLTTFITHPFLKNVNLTRKIHLMKISSTGMFNCLLKIWNWIEALMNTIGRNVSLMKLKGFHFQGILEHTYFHAKGEKIILHSLLKVFNMFYIRLWNHEQLHADVIGIQCNNFDRTVTYQF